MLTAACGHTDTAAKNTTTTAVPTTSVVPAKEPTIDIAKLPLCGDVKDTASRLPADCKLVSKDSAGHTFVVRHVGFEKTSAGGDSRVVLVDVVGKDLVDNSDFVLDRAMVETGNDLMGGEPLLKDIDADGRDELLVPVGGGSGGTSYAVYRDTVADSSTKEPKFVRLGYVNGSIPEHTASGYIAVRGKGSCCEWEVQFLRIDNSQLRQYVRVEIDATHDATGQGHSTCKVIDSSGLAGSGLSDIEVTRQFCAEPLVVQSMPYK
ncbi:hypothetical protein [Nocardia sp. NPDC004722]